MSARTAVGPARRRTVIGAVVAAALLLGGCANAPAYDPDTAEQLQQQVLDVTTASAEGAYDVARTGLLELEADARDAHARGLITAERLDSILAAIVLVTASLDAEIAAVEQAEAERLAAEEAARAAEEAARAAEEARQAAEQQEAAEREQRGNDNRGGEGRGGRGRDDDGD
ncbi:hypothetical protein EV141_0352 [Microcella putealis]|uniref:Mucin-associated surface protein n=1 Tax=Microcella putealis TaxID=337005 RepID=A0A4Q7LVN0_9MICO|nr:hypothetical protein [Microcella putealis]RZS59135.1 hypothetical protein EV141_0352 [Microcella putealis]TQM24161.1 hypothetical protein BJ957_1631 [Microcella putealis]